MKLFMQSEKHELFFVRTLALWLRRPASHFLFFLLIINLAVGCTAEKQPTANKKVHTKAACFPQLEIDTQLCSADSLLYNPTNDTLSSVCRKEKHYELSTWNENNGWTTGVASWKTKKNETLDNFSYNTTGALFACLKTYKSNQLQKQDVVRLRGNGDIESLSLIGLKDVTLQKKSSSLTEIKDLQCFGTSLAITYQYGAVKIYNIAEKQALGASNITGSGQHSIFYDLHYLTIMKDTSSQEILLYDYDIRSGEVVRSFPLGGNGQDSRDFHLCRYQNQLCLVSEKGIFTGPCTETVLTKQLDYKDLQLPVKHRITYCQAARDDTIYIGYETSDSAFHLRKFTIA